MTRAQLADFGRNIATQVANGKVKGMLAEQIASISAAIADASDELAAADNAQVAAKAAAIETTRIAQEKQARLLKLLQQLKYLMRSLESNASEFDALGFKAPVKVRQMVKPKIPFDLSAAGYSNGINVLKYNGENKPNTVNYTIEAKIGDADGYQIVGTSKNRTFKHEGVKPGVRIQYRVRSQATRGGVSDWSNEAVVYAN